MTIWERIQAAWTALLDFLGQLVSPDWNALIGWVPWLLLLLALGVLALIGIRWLVALPRNRPRVPKRLTAPPPPPGTHVSHPSRWPFVIPVGAAVAIFALVAKAARVEQPKVDPTTGAITVGQGASITDVVNVPVFVLGLAIVAVGIVGWYRDANREWLDVAAIEPKTEDARIEEGAGQPPLEAPPGAHIPGPSPWPFFAPVGLAFTLFGLILSPALVFGGIVMTAIAVGGWYRESTREYRFVEHGRPPEPPTRDPERAFPKTLAVVYVFIALLSLAAAATPQILTLANAKPAPSSSASAGAGGGGSAITLDARDVKFAETKLTAPVAKALTVSLVNHDGVPHNFAVLKPGSTSDFLFNGQPLANGGQTVTYQVPALPAGEYQFICVVHPATMIGTLTVK